jgi:hypothetical protein
MKTLIVEISRIRQMMGIIESIEDDKKISDEFEDIVKNTSIDDLISKQTNDKNYQELRTKAVEANHRLSQYKKIENATSLDELINLFSKDWGLKNYVKNNFFGNETFDGPFSSFDEKIGGIVEVLCFFNGGSEDECIKGSSYLTDYDEQNGNYPIDWDKANNLLDLIPGFREKVYKLKRIKSANKIKSNFENTQTNIEKNKQTISADQYISKLNYSDVGYDNVDAGGSMRKYAEALSKEDPNEVESLVKSLISRFKDLMTTKVNKEISRAGMSESWAYWDVGKQLYFYSNPEESNYKLGNPLTDKSIQQTIINRMIGWEVSNGGKKPNGDKYSSEELSNIGETYI